MRKKTKKKANNILYSIVIIAALVGSVLGYFEGEVDFQTATPVSTERLVIEEVGALKVTYIDVGQGDSIYIKTPAGDDILIDAGEADQGRKVVDFLKSEGVDDIEVLIATHPHSDHIGGLPYVLENMSVESVYAPKLYHSTKTYENFLLAVQKQGLQINDAGSGVELNLPGVDAKFIAPVVVHEDDLNASSAVLKLNHKETSFLFTGDATTKTEADILASGADILSDVLKLGHHGSNTSSGATFLKKVNPSFAIVSAIKDSEYGHPHKEVVDRLNNMGVKILSTAEMGNITILSDGENVKYLEK